MLTPEARFRRFARAVTTEVGALDTSFLGRGRPLGAARVVAPAPYGRARTADAAGQGSPGCPNRQSSVRMPQVITPTSANPTG